MKKILMVEDNNSILNLFITLFKNHGGYDIQTANNGLEALEKIAEDKPDILLTDINMPVLDGRELCKRVRNNTETKDIYIVVSSGNPLPEETREYVDSFFLKPYPFQELIEKLEDIGGKENE
ncbi:MAG: response regulator [Nanoarchaeota archaeon]|nr:response regulator [Nanoarchaeota archaeon]